MSDIGRLVLQVREGETIKIGTDIRIQAKEYVSKDGRYRHTAVMIEAPKSIAITRENIKQG